MAEKLGWYPHPTFEKWAQPFEDKYQMADIVMDGDATFQKSKTKKQTGRHCIFCNKSYPETTFRNASHLVPKMIGNTNL